MITVYLPLLIVPLLLFLLWGFVGPQGRLTVWDEKRQRYRVKRFWIKR